MSIKDAYEIINLGETNKEVTVALIQQEFNKSKLKAKRNEALLRLYIKWQEEKQNPEERAIIEEAYEILLKVLRHHEYASDGRDVSEIKKELFSMNEDNSENRKTINKYLLLFNVFSITKEYSLKMSSYVSIPKLYELMTNYKRLYCSLTDNFKYLDNSDGIEFNIHNYDELMASDELYGHLNKWLDGKFQEDFSYNVTLRDENYNILPLMIERVKRAYELSIKTHQANKAMVLAKAIHEIKLADEDKKISLIMVYSKMLGFIDSDLKGILKSYDLFSKMTRNLSEQNITPELVEYFSNKIKDLLQKEEITIINNSELFQKKMTFLGEKADKLPLCHGRFMECVNESRADMLDMLKEKFAMVQDLNRFACIITKQELVIDDNDTMDVLISKNDLLDEAIIYGRLKVMDIHYRTIIYYYAVYEDISLLPTVIYDCYCDAKEDPTNVDKINMAYELIYRVHENVSNKMNPEDYQTIDTYDIITKQIEELYDVIIGSKLELPRDIQELYNSRKKLEYITLYDLYMKLDRFYDSKFIILR